MTDAAHRGVEESAAIAAAYSRGMTTPAEGKKAPAFTLPDQNDTKVQLSKLQGRKVLVYFYPRASTPGCTTQACGLRDIAGEIGDTVVIGISPDKPSALKKFDDKYELGFTLLGDQDHAIAAKYGVWVLKKNYGKEYMGVQRSAFLIDEEGKIEKAWPKISPKDTPTKLLAALAES
ncbi:MAG TPA: thioredoxin-dependent thiol peroxidase [Ilumatobacter sp.]|nr:thioredoxin-dependent thiol peroxidase [Ilumatobacter sp.]